MIREKLTWYLKALPKAWRNRLTPVPEVVTAFLEAVTARPERETRRDRRGAACVLRARASGDAMPADVWDAAPVPAHLQMNVRVVDGAGTELAQGRDLARAAGAAGRGGATLFRRRRAAFERNGIRRWDFGDLPESLAIVRDGRSVTGYPALVDEGGSVALRLYDTKRRGGRGDTGGASSR